MKDDEAEAIGWVGEQSQRVMTWSGAPFIVTGFVGMAPAFFLAQDLFGNVKVSAVLACVPAIVFVLVGMKVSEQIRRWMLPSLISRAARRFDIDEKPLRDVLL